MRNCALSLLSTLICLSAFSQTTYYVNDNSLTGDVFTSAVGSNGNSGTATAPFATLSYAITQAVANDIVYVDAGNYAEQVIINKGITIIGAGQTFTFFTPPATALVPAPGPFTEIGLFETTQGIGDVHISNLSINSNNASQNIIIQSGGSVKNCTLLNGNQGIFFRIESTTKTAMIENNTIEPGFIGINCQGGGLTATIRNNNISKASSFYAGIFAGLDFGPLPKLTVQNNIINNYFGEGLLVNSFNGSYTQNSITGTGAFAINRGGGNTPIATCNWFGSFNPATVASKINGTVIYTPFLTDGTDNSSSVGFQPNVSCGGNSIYVNDGSATGDVFTTALGSDINLGTAAAPFATLQFAVNVANPNDVIYVDAGTYTEQVTITKGITIFGAGQNLTSILKPATTIPPPGPFTEQGVLQTAQNIGDVNIKDVSITGDYNVGVTPIIMQSGGSLRNCKLQSGNQGIFVRIDPATNPSAKTFVIEGNIIDAEYIAVNVTGPNLTAILNNNTLTANNTSFSTGMFAGLDFGPIGRITATNNLFSKYNTDGILISASNASITQNAFTGSGPKAINRLGGANIAANCNWYGVANATAIVTKITAGVNYYPWLTDGTDNSPSPGFQHYAEACGATTNTYYVNDNSTTGDLFTTAIGNDANTGTPIAPFATLGAALNVATPGATIYMDAGTYVAQNLTINKTVQIIGTNYNVSPNSPSDPLVLNPVRNAESIIENSNWGIGADGISITGLTFNPISNNAVILNNATFSNINMSRNRVRINSLFPPFFFTGSGTPTMGLSGIVNWGLTITENRFEKEDASTGNTIRINRFGSVTVRDNTFMVTGSTARTQNSMAIGNNGVVAYLNVYNNTFDRAALALNTSSLGFTNINKNSFINSNSAFVGNNSFSESSDVFFINNMLDGSSGIVPFVQYTRQAGDAAGSSSSFTAEDNTISGSAIAGTTTLLGSMNLTFANSVLNQSLKIRNNRITYNGDFSTVQGQLIRPIMMRGNLKNAIIEKNEITLSGTNLQPADPAANLPVCPAITLYTENGAAAFLQPGSVINILNNKISGFRHSFAAYDPAASNDAYIGFGNIPSGVTVNVNNNSFAGDSISINNGTVGQPVLATCNWYGSADAAVVVPKISGIATYGPWLTNGTDTDAGTGFQPLPDVCNGRQNKFYVNDNSNTGDVFTTAVGNDANAGIPSAPLRTIAAALAKATSGDEIYVDAGPYEPGDFTIRMPIKIYGANYLISPNDAANALLPNGGRNEETFITGSTISVMSNDVSIKGFYFEPGAKTQIRVLNSGYNNFSYIRNYSRITSGTFMSLTGPTIPNAQTPAFGNYTIEENRFEKAGTLSGIAVTAAYLNNVSVNNNVFLTPSPATQRVLLNCYAGFGGVATNFKYSNNVSEASNYDLFSFYLASGVIENNKSLQSRRTFFVQSVAPGSADVQIINNYIETDFSTTSPIYCSNFDGALAGSTCNVLIQDNTVIQNAAGKNTIPSASSVFLSGTSPNTVATINRNKFTFTGDFGLFANSNVVGLSLSGKLQNVLVQRNEIAFNGTNLTSNVQLNTAASSGIYISSDGGAANPIPGNAVMNFLENKITGFSNSIAIFDPSSVVPNSYIGYGNLPLGATVNINNNSFTGDLMSINNGAIGQAVNASCNWYGSKAAQDFISKLTLPTVDIVPWLTNGTDNEIATGFQPVPGSCDGYPTLITLNGSTNVTCNGAANGTINITTSFGKAPFTYTWTKDGDANFVSHDEDPTGLAPGVYHLAILDGNGSNIYIIDPNADGPGTIDVTITEPPVLTASASGTNNLCFGNANGSASVTAGGGTAPYTYLWSNGGTANMISNLPAGNYSVTVTDANGCTANAQYQVTQPSLLVATATGTSTSCLNSASVVASGGAGSYTYLWSNGGITQTISSIPVGTYTVTVTDANGCTTTANTTVSGNQAFNPSVSTTNVSCFGGADGVLTVTNANGVAPFSYSLDGINFQPQNVFNNLTAGSYTVTVKDALGCTGFNTKIVGAPSPIVVTLNSLQTTCCGAATGAISTTASGGSAAYIYGWIGPNGYTATSSNISNLPAGNYTLTVTDKNGCTAVLAATVLSYPQITLSSTVANIACKGETNGAINNTISGGSGAGFSYVWNGGTTTEDRTGLSAGNYTFTATDLGNGCSVSASFVITQPANAVNLSVSKSNAVDCNLGTLTATGSGGTAPYQYRLGNGAYQLSGVFTGLGEGSYIVEVKDANGCTKTSAQGITDNGSDAYEGNNNKKQTVPTLTLGATINARIGSATDVDWFQFTTPVGAATYQLMVTHSNTVLAFSLDTSGKNASAPIAVSSTPTSKTYNLAGGTLYYVQVSGAASAVCYSLLVTPVVAAPITATSSPEAGSPKLFGLAPDKLTATPFPNPHRGSFTLGIESPVNGEAQISLYDLQGRTIQMRKALLTKGSNTVKFDRVAMVPMVYTVMVDGMRVTGKILAMQ